MQGFSKNYIKRQKRTYEDEYDKDVTNAAKKSQKIQAKSFVEFATTQSALRFIGRSYSMVVLAIFSSAIIYPFSVRIVKKVFGLRSFFNIHFAIIPIIANFNAFVLGSFQGYLNYSQFKYNYHIFDK